eukprot:Skav221941  [mRNA]  locus=scaffold195:387962:388361:+ [translate_table: standard]
MKCHLVAFLGPRGLTRLALRFREPSSACAMELASACNVHDVQAMKDMSKLDHIEAIECELRTNRPCFVEYAAEKRGYTVTVGYVV